MYAKEVAAKTISLPSEAIAWTRRLEEISVASKVLDTEEKALKAQIKFAMGDAERGLLPDNSAAWKWPTITKKAIWFASALPSTP